MRNDDRNSWPSRESKSMQETQQTTGEAASAVESVELEAESSRTVM